MNMIATKVYRLDKSRMKQSIIDFLYGAVSGILLAVLFFIGM